MEIPKKKLARLCIICRAEGFETKFQRLIEDAKHKALQYKTFDPTWEVNVTQFCHNYYIN